ncbi:MAG: hypothetical protein ACRC3Z_01225 [Phocaeicola sp.]
MEKELAGIKAQNLLFMVLMERFNVLIGTGMGIVHPKINRNNVSVASLLMIFLSGKPFKA